MPIFGDLPGLVVDLRARHQIMKSRATKIDKLDLTSGGLAVAATDDVGRFGTARATTLIIDTLVLSVFSVVYEIAVILLRIRSRLSAGAPRR
jgi:hypothetical protein